MAVWRRKPKGTVLVHSDQGVQYTCSDWRTFLKDNNLEASMSRRGNCWDNAVAESFFSLLKGERIRGRVYLTRAEARGDIFDYIEMFDMDYVCTDDYPAYNRIVPKGMHVQTKAETCAVESLNSRIRHYLARFHRKTFCYSKAVYMVQATLTLFFTSNWIEYLF